MRVRFIALTLAVCGACLFALPEPLTPAEPQRAGTMISMPCGPAMDAMKRCNSRKSGA